MNIIETSREGGPGECDSPADAEDAGESGWDPKQVFDEIRAGMLADRAQYLDDFTTPFFGVGRPGAKVSDGARRSFWMQSMQGGLKAELECVAAFSETDFTEDLKKFDVPTLFLHGDQDQNVPIDVGARAAVKLVPGAVLEYEGAPHAIPTTHKDRVSEDLLEFIEATSKPEARTRRSQADVSL